MKGDNDNPRACDAQVLKVDRSNPSRINIFIINQEVKQDYSIDSGFAPIMILFWFFVFIILSAICMHKNLSDFLGFPAVVIMFGFWVLGVIYYYAVLRKKKH